MIRWKAAAVSTLTTAVLAVPGSAFAQNLSIADAAGDARANGLDITGVTLHNHDHAFGASVRFTGDRRGKVIVAVRTRSHLVAVIVSEHHRSGPGDTYLIGSGACPRLTGTWNRSAATLELRLPAHCVGKSGNYGALKAWVLTEPLGNGGDVDWAPQRRNGDIRFSELIPRG